MAAPPQSQMPPPQPYPGMYYQPMTPEHLLSHRNVFFANAFGLVLIWLAMILRLVTTDVNLAKFDVFLIFTGGILAAAASIGAALGSKKTTDMQNVGLFVWAGLVLAFAAYAVGALGL